MARKLLRDTDGYEVTGQSRLPLEEEYDAEFRGYINLSLTAAQKARFAEWEPSKELWLAFEGFVTDGINLSVKIDPKNKGFLASATQRRRSSPNAGLVVTARARSAVEAQHRLLYVLVLLSVSERWEDVQPLADPDRW